MESTYWETFAGKIVVFDTLLTNGIISFLLLSSLLSSTGLVL